MLTWDRRAVTIASALYGAALLFILFNPSAHVPSSTVAGVADVLQRLGVPATLASGGRVEFGLNVVMLVPLAVLGSYFLPRSDWRDWVAYGFVLSCSVELAQGLFLGGRSATFSDVVANTLGAGIGALLMAWLRSRATAD